MPNTGSVTPPATTPPLASTSYAHPSPGAGTSAERDPFLGAAARIPLTEEERQEGYDVELLNARPRGRYSADAASDDSLSRGEKYGGAGLGPVTTHPGGAAGALPPPLAASALPAGAYGVGIGGAALGAVGSGAERPGGGGGGGKEYGALEHSSGTTAMSGKKRKPWFLRPLPLGLLAAFIVAVALAVGLGVGLSTRHSSSSSDDDDSASSNSSRISRSLSSRSRTATISTGTVVPSSLYSSYTVDHPQSESSSIISTSVSVDDDTSSSTTILLPTLTSIPSVTALATTGNIPIPAASAATVNGTVYSALTNTPDETGAAASATARVRYARQRYWRG
ncbi:hypothetical protein JCM6882_007299 [Rhodosporidiobolus microsporus]